MIRLLKIMFALLIVGTVVGFLLAARK